MTYKTERLLVGFKPCLRDGKFDFDNCCSDKKVDLLNLQPSDDCENMVFQLYLKEDNMNIGHISLYNKYGKLEVAYETNALFRGKGYMTEALTFAVKWIFDNTTEDSIWALIEDDNMNSISVAKRCGFTEREIYEHISNWHWFKIERAIGTK